VEADWARLRRNNMVLNFDRPIDRAIAYAEEEIKIQKLYYGLKKNLLTGQVENLLDEHFNETFK
jgi:hypothetical protein